LSRTDSTPARRSEDTDPASRRIASVLMNGVLLAITLSVFRVETAHQLDLELSGADWLLLALPELGFVLAFEFFWLLIASSRSKASERLWRWGFLPGHLLAYLLAVTAHQFFMRTGTVLTVDVLLYAVRNLIPLRGVIASGIDFGLVQRLSPALLCLAFAYVQSRGGFRRSLPYPRALATAGLLVGAAILAWAPALSSQPFVTSGIVELFRTTDLDRESLTTTYEVYEPPQLTRLDVARKPNILLIILESLRADLVSPYAAPAEHDWTPSLNRIAAKSIVIETAYASVTHTTKALVGILCGMFPVLQQRIFEVRPGQMMAHCLPHLLEPLGYRTAFMQSAFAWFEQRTGLVHNFGFQHEVFGEALAEEGFEEVGYLGVDDFSMLEKSLSWIRHGGDEPYFLTLLTLNTHHPYASPGLGEPPDLEAERDYYHAAVSYVDRFTGAVFDSLEASGDLENTVVIIVSDHGEAFGEHQRRQHDAVPYEEVVRLVFTIHGPAWLGEPRTIPGLRHQVDILPTVLDILGVGWRGRLPGRSVLSGPPHDFVLSSCWYTKTCLALRSGRMKYVYHFGRKPTEVFDLERDPLETQDLRAEVTSGLVDAAEARMLSLYASIHQYYAKQTRRMFEREIVAPR
jgi:arylsulfatase A-like enzyme